MLQTLCTRYWAACTVQYVAVIGRELFDSRCPRFQQLSGSIIVATLAPNVFVGKQSLWFGYLLCGLPALSPPWDNPDNKFVLSSANCLPGRLILGVRTQTMHWLCRIHQDIYVDVNETNIWLLSSSVASGDNEFPTYRLTISY